MTSSSRSGSVALINEPCRITIAAAIAKSRSRSVFSIHLGAYSATGTLAWEAEPYASRRNRTERKAVIPPHDKS